MLRINRIYRQVAVLVGFLVCVQAVGLGEVLVRMTSVQGRVHKQKPKRPEHKEHRARLWQTDLYNDRFTFELNHEACFDKSHNLPKGQVSLLHPGVQQRFTPLGMGRPSKGNWAADGFLDVVVNGQGFAQCELASMVARYYGVDAVLHGRDYGVDAVLHARWENDQAVVHQYWVLHEGDDKLLLEVRIEPKGQVKSLEVRLRNVSVDKKDVQPNLVVATATNEVENFQANKSLKLEVKRQWWVMYSNRAAGISPSGLLFLPDDVQEAAVRYENGIGIVTTLTYRPQARRLQVAFWDWAGYGNEEILTYLRRHAKLFRKQLAARAEHGWTEPAQVAAVVPLRLLREYYELVGKDAERGYATYGVVPFDYVIPATVPKEGQLTDTISTFGSPGEFVPATFCVYAGKDLKNVIVSAGELKSGRNAIPAANIDPRVVKVWYQKNNGLGVSANMRSRRLAPEILMKDDAVKLIGVVPEEGRLPSILFREDVRTDIPKDTTKQFWLTVKIPADAKPGVYEGPVTVEPQNAPASKVILKLEVLPIALLEPKDKTFSIYFRQVLAPDAKRFVRRKNKQGKVGFVMTERLTESQYRQYLQNLADHGFNSVSIYGGLRQAKVVMPILKEMGFKGPFVTTFRGAYEKNFSKANVQKWQKVAQEYLDLAKSGDYGEPVLYQIDEAYGEALATVKKWSGFLRQVGARTAMSCLSPKIADLVRGTVDILVAGFYYDDRFCEENRKQGSESWRYWQCWNENPRLDRLLMGYAFYLSGYDAIMPYAYSHVSGDPYYDFEYPYKDFLSVYPSAEGPVDTMQWEACREGKDDYRYVYTLFGTIEKAKEALKKQANPELAALANRTEKELAEILAKYSPKQTEGWGRFSWTVIFPRHKEGLPNEQFQLDRRRIAEMIVSLQELLVRPVEKAASAE